MAKKTKPAVKKIEEPMDRVDQLDQLIDLPGVSGAEAVAILAEQIDRLVQMSPGLQTRRFKAVKKELIELLEKERDFR